MIKKRLITLSVASVILAGCQTTNPYTGEQQAAKSAKYSGLGVLAGAVIGAAANGKDGALAGAALGGLAGASYGAYTDRQEAALRNELQGTGVQVVRNGDNLKLVMPGNITFDSSKATIQASFYPVLGSVARVIKNYNENPVVITGQYGLHRQ